MSSTTMTLRSFEAGVEVLLEPDLARRLRAGAVARHRDEVHRDARAHRPHQVGHEHEAALEHARRGESRRRPDSPARSPPPAPRRAPGSSRRRAIRSFFFRPPPAPAPAMAFASRDHVRRRSSVSTFAVAHQHLPVHDRRPHVVAARDVDEVRDRIVHRRLPRARHRRRSIRSARFPASSEPIRSAMPSARAPLDRRHRRARRARARPADRRVASLCRNAAWRIASNMSRSLLLAAPSVPSPTGDAGRAHRRHRRGAARQLHVALGIVRHADLPPGEHLDVGRRRARRRARPACAAPRSRATRDSAVGDSWCCLCAISRARRRSRRDG